MDEIVFPSGWSEWNIPCGSLCLVYGFYEIVKPILVILGRLILLHWFLEELLDGSKLKLITWASLSLSLENLVLSGCGRYSAHWNFHSFRLSHSYVHESWDKKGGRQETKRVSSILKESGGWLSTAWSCFLLFRTWPSWIWVSKWWKSLLFLSGFIIKDDNLYLCFSQNFGERWIIR